MIESMPTAPLETRSRTTSFNPPLERSSLPPLLIDDIPDLIANSSDILKARGQSLEAAYKGFAGLGFALENADAPTTP